MRYAVKRYRPVDMPIAPMNSSPTVTAILDAAQSRAQQVGYGGLSFRDVASDVGIKSASVHHHFPTKGQLGAAVARRYTDGLVAHLESVDARNERPSVALAAYVAAIRSTLEQGGRMCLCGMLAAETDAIPLEVRAEVRRFVDLNVLWIARTLARAAGATAPGAATREHARAIFAALEGAMLFARGTGDLASFDRMAKQFRRVGLIPF